MKKLEDIVVPEKQERNFNLDHLRNMAAGRYAKMSKAVGREEAALDLIGYIEKYIHLTKTKQPAVRLAFWEVHKWETLGAGLVFDQWYREDTVKLFERIGRPYE